MPTNANISANPISIDTEACLVSFVRARAIVSIALFVFVLLAIVSKILRNWDNPIDDDLSSCVVTIFVPFELCI